MITSKAFGRQKAKREPRLFVPRWQSASFLYLARGEYFCEEIMKKIERIYSVVLLALIVAAGSHQAATCQTENMWKLVPPPLGMHPLPPPFFDVTLRFDWDGVDRMRLEVERIAARTRTVQEGQSRDHERQRQSIQNVGQVNQGLQLNLGVSQRQLNDLQRQIQVSGLRLQDNLHGVTRDQSVLLSLGSGRLSRAENQQQLSNSNWRLEPPKTGIDVYRLRPPPPMNVYVVQPPASKGIETLVEQFKQNQGLRLMSIMTSTFEGAPYYSDEQTDNDHFYDQTKVDYFKTKRRVPLVKIGGESFHKAEGTTNCVYAPLETIYIAFGGANGSINGIPISDPFFKGFVAAFVGNGKEWIKYLEQARVGEEITDMNNLTPGDLVNLGGGHHAWVSDLEFDNNDRLLKVKLLEANGPDKKDKDWKTRSAIHEDRWVHVTEVKVAFRFYDWSYGIAAGR